MGRRLSPILIILHSCIIQLVLVEPDCRHGYFESHPGHMLQGHVIRRISTESVWSCILECRQLLMCFSLNVHPDKDTKVLECELNKSTRKASPKDYVRVSSSGQEYLELIPNSMDKWMTQPLACSSSDRKALPNSWYSYQSFVYKYFNEKQTNEVARQRCLDLHIGGDLVSLTNDMEKDFVKSLADFESKINASIQAKNRKVWIGLNDKTKEGTFEWYDGTPFTYTNWADTEPNNQKGKEHCAIFFTDGLWNDINCNNTFEYVCKAPAFR